MNIEMLKCLVDLAGKKVDTVHLNEFFNRFPKSTENLSDLSALKRSGYISVLYADDDIYQIGVNKAAIDYFK